jgi:hypothetical protein
MSCKENDNNNRTIAFVQLHGLHPFTRQSGWVQMQASSDDNFGDLVELHHKNGVLDESQMVAIGCLPCQASHHPTKVTNVTDRVACKL